MGTKHVIATRRHISVACCEVYGGVLSITYLLADFLSSSKADPAAQARSFSLPTCRVDEAVTQTIGALRRTILLYGADGLAK